MAHIPNGETYEDTNFLCFIETIVQIDFRSQMLPKPETIADWSKTTAGIFISNVWNIGSFYLMFIGLQYITTDNFFCREMQPGTQILLSNESKLHSKWQNRTFEELFDLRKWYATGATFHEEPGKGLLSTGLHTYGGWVNQHTFEQQFRNISDIIEEFNHRGFHDMCNVFSYTNDLETRSQSILPPGFASHNTSGNFKKYNRQQILRILI